MYLQAYVRDDFFLHRLSDLLEKIDSQFCLKTEIGMRENEKRNEDRKSRFSRTENMAPIYVENENENENGNENENENEKWMKDLKCWSLL